MEISTIPFEKEKGFYMVSVFIKTNQSSLTDNRYYTRLFNLST